MKRVLSSALIASFALSSSLAGAAGKYTKKESEITATQTALTKPVQHVKDEKKKPTITADDVFGGVGEKVKSVTDQQIKVLQRLIDNTNDTDPEKPDLLFRMGELYNEQYRYYDFRARELDEKIFNAGNAGNQGLAGQLKGQQADYQKKSQTWLLASAKAYLEVADHPDKYGSYKRMDEVLFYLAYMLNQVKKEDAARKYFKRLIKDYPKSRFIPYAFLAFGDYFFDQKQLEDSLKFYDKVMQFPESPIYGYAKYKEGWVYYNLGDFKQALATFVSVIELSEKGGKNPQKIALGKESKKDSVRAYARIGTPEKAWDFFRRIGGNYAMTMMEQLGELYNAQGQFQDSIKVYRNLMVLEPGSPKLCYWQGEVMKNTLSATGSRAQPDNVKELQRLGAVYEKVKEAKGLKKEQLEECRDTTRNTLGELATVWHKEAQKTNNNDTYALAQYLYKEYLTRFPKEKDVYQMTFYYGELLFKLGSNGDNNSYCNAAPIYTKVVELNPAPTAKYLKEAAYAAVISWKNCLSIEDTGSEAVEDMKNKRSQLKEAGKKGKEGKEAKEDEELVLKPQPISENKKKMVAAFDTYIKYVPDSPELPNIKYRKARIFYEANQFTEALPLFKDIADHHQTSDLAYYSTNLLFDCLGFKKQYDELQAALEQYCPMYEEKDATVKGQCAVLKSQLGRKRIELAEKQGRYKEVAFLYMKQGQDYPNDPKIDEIYYNAAVNFERAKLLGSAIQAREILLKVKPDSTLAKKAVYQIGRNFSDVAAYDKAADFFEQFAEKFPGEKEASVALYSASFYRRGLGDNDKAIKDVSLFVKDYGGRHEFVDQAATVAFDEAQIYEQQKDNAKLQKHFLDYLKVWGAKGGVDHQVIAHVKIGEILWNQSCALPDGGINGACIELKRERAGGAARAAEKAKLAQKGSKKKGKKKGASLPGQCGPETKSKIIVHDRGPAKLKEAMTHFAEALKLFKGGAADKSVPGKDEATRTARTIAMNYYASEARFKQGDVEYEKLLKIAMPDKLDFSGAPPGSSVAKEKAGKAKKAEAEKKFKAWLDNKTKQLQASLKIYQSVIQMKQAHWVIAAAARIGQLYQDFSGQLYTAPVPKAPAAPAGYPQEDFELFFHDAYCDAMVDNAEPIEAHAIEGLSTCLNKSTDLSFYDEWSQLCESELNQLKPAEYPIASEIRAPPGYVSQVAMDRADVQPLETK